MHLKREVDYAFRIVLHLTQCFLEDKDTCVTETTKSTGVPASKVKKICLVLEENHLIKAIELNHSLCYQPLVILLDLTIYDISKLFNDEIAPFMIFDKKNVRYKSCQHTLNKIEEVCIKTFMQRTIAEFI